MLTWTLQDHAVLHSCGSLWPQPSLPPTILPPSPLISLQTPPAAPDTMHYIHSNNQTDSICGPACNALCTMVQVGSIQFTAEVGQRYEKGEELGYFAFGGSTCIAIFQKDAVVVDEDIVSNR